MTICIQRYIKVDHFLCLQISIVNYHNIFEIPVLKNKFCSWQKMHPRAGALLSHVSSFTREEQRKLTQCVMRASAALRPYGHSTLLTREPHQDREQQVAGARSRSQCAAQLSSDMDNLALRSALPVAICHRFSNMTHSPVLLHDQQFHQLQSK